MLFNLTLNLLPKICNVKMQHVTISKKKQLIELVCRCSDKKLIDRYN